MEALSVHKSGWKSVRVSRTTSRGQRPRTREHSQIYHGSSLISSLALACRGPVLSEFGVFVQDYKPRTEAQNERVCSDLAQFIPCIPTWRTVMEDESSLKLAHMSRTLSQGQRHRTREFAPI
jgi:hypothetical protein